MRAFQDWFDSLRWEWFAAGDPDVAPTAPVSSDDNSAHHVLFEVGLFLLIPLGLAALIEIILR